MKKIHQLADYMRNDIHPITIRVAGVGGNGSFFIPMLAKINLFLLDRGFKGIHVTAYDPKEIAAYLVGRQNFTEGDVGDNKAINIIEKINMGYGFNWTAVPDYAPPIIEGNIFVTCVDSAAYRMKLKRTEFPEAGRDMGTNYYWLDMGNGKDFGQVILGSDEIPQPAHSNRFNFIPKLMDVREKYGELTQYEKDQGIVSCSFRDTIAQQGLFTNNYMAIEAANLLYDLFKNKILDYHGKLINLATGESSKFYL